MESALTTRLGVELALQLAGQCHREGRFGEVLKAAEQALGKARELGDLPLEIKAALERARALYMLGERAGALQGCTWVLGVVHDPARREELKGAGLEWEVMEAHLWWASAAGFLPEMTTAKLFEVLDAGEAYVRGIGRPGWRAGLLQVRAGLLDDLGRREEAIAAAEEGLALKLRHGSGPGATLGTHRWGLGDLLRWAGRAPEAAPYYQAVLDDPASSPYDRMAALQGLALCALAAGDAPAAIRQAEEAVRLAEPMGDEALHPVLEALIMAHRAAGNLPAARLAAGRMLECARRLRSDNRLYFALRSAADVALDEGDASQARALLDEAKPLAAALDRQRGLTIFHDDTAALRRRLAALDAPPP